MGLLLHQHFGKGSSLVVDFIFICLRGLTHFSILRLLCLLQFINIVPGLVGVIIVLQFWSREESRGLGKSKTLV